MVEEWRTVIYDGEIYEGYEVSNTGKVRSLDRVCHGERKTAGGYKWKFVD